MYTKYGVVLSFTYPTYYIVLCKVASYKVLNLIVDLCYWPILYSVLYTNCLAYRHWYQPKFFNWLPVFLEKAAQTTGMNQDLIIRCQFFSCCYLFVSLWHCSHISVLPIEWWWFNIFLFFVLWGLRVVVVSYKIQKAKGKRLTS